MAATTTKVSSFSSSADRYLSRAIYKNLWAAEDKRRPRADFLEWVQNDITADMRASTVDWVAHLLEELHLDSPETLYLAVNYMDRCLSRRDLNRHWLQLLASVCLLIASKHEQRHAPRVQKLLLLMEENYTKEEALQMESQVLSLLNFELTAPTPKCFLSGLVHVARGPPQLEFLADFIAELSLLEYHMLQYPPSMIAASSLFLARFVLRPKEHPWTRRLADYSFYQPYELSECVKDLFWAFVFSSGSRLTAIRNKYSKPKHLFVAAKYFCSAPAIPERYFSHHPLPLH